MPLKEIFQEHIKFISVLIAATALGITYMMFSDSRDDTLERNAAARATLNQKLVSLEKEVARLRSDKSDIARNAASIKELKALLEDRAANPNVLPDQIMETFARFESQLNELNKRVKDQERVSSSGVDTSDLDALISKTVTAEVTKKVAAIANAHSAPNVKYSATVTDKNIVKSGSLTWTFKQCSHSHEDVISCKISIKNTATDDRKACISDAEAVTDTGMQTKKPELVTVGEQSRSYHACSMVPPRTIISAEIMFELGGSYKEKLSLVRFKCGGNCKVAAYDVAVEL